MTLRITVEDLETGDSDTRDLRDGDYCLVVAQPCYLSNTTHYANGTAMLTIKGRSVGLASGDGVAKRQELAPEQVGISRERTS